MPAFADRHDVVHDGGGLTADHADGVALEEQGTGRPPQRSVVEAVEHVRHLGPETPAVLRQMLVAERTLVVMFD